MIFIFYSIIYFVFKEIAWGIIGAGMLYVNQNLAVYIRQSYRVKSYDKTEINMFGSL